MPDSDKDSKQDRQKNTDLEVFRVPPKEWLEEQSKSSDGLNIESKPGKDVLPEKSEAESFVQPAQKEEPLGSVSTPSSEVQPSAQPLVPPPAQPPAPPQVPQPQKPQPGPGPESIYPLPQEKRISPEASSEPSLAPRPTPTASISETKTKLEKPRPLKTKTRKGLILLLALIIIVLIPLGLIALEWLGVYSLGLSKWLGPPPSRFIASKANFNFSTFSAELSGEIKIKDQGLISEWAKENLSNLSEFSFSSYISKDQEKVAGVFQWADEPNYSFYFKQGTLYLQSEEADWYKIELGDFNLEPFFQNLGSSLKDYRYFKRIKSSSPYWWYSLTLGDFLNFEPYVSMALSEVLLAINPSDFNMAEVQLKGQLSDGTAFSLFLESFSNLAQVPEFDESQVKKDETKFKNFISFVNLIKKESLKKETEFKEETESVSESKRRDTERKKNLAEIAEALANYYQTNGRYPEYSGKIKIEEHTPFQEELAPYLSQPREWDLIDPQHPDFYYAYISNGENFELTARLEDTSDPEGHLVGTYWIYFVISNRVYNPTLSETGPSS